MENLTSRPLDVLVSVDRESPRTLGRQIEDQLRNAIRDLTLRPGARLPSTRDLARELGVSRPIVVDAYAQLAGEGYLELRPGTRPRVTGCAGPREMIVETVITAGFRAAFAALKALCWSPEVAAQPAHAADGASDLRNVR